MLYAHHMTNPTAEGEQPEYHMTQLRTFSMTDTRETFIVGSTVVRNARDLARQQRESLIQEANARALQARGVARRECNSEERDGNHPHRHINHSEAKGWQDSHDDLQQQIAETYTEAYEQNGPTNPTYTSDGSQDPGQDPAASGTCDPSMSLCQASLRT
ncbi:hypothetical protein IF1G_11227 [Cordyceps javanica]|uniref:Uncharacterized protein n=1 Tax=Cordyceps javanica TaxID=43265 RepID=A0A545UKX8_9HYPO|nr:hypothetical protein IF1G_11227 [Cordyceps javanica]